MLVTNTDKTVTYPERSFRLDENEFVDVIVPEYKTRFPKYEDYRHLRHITTLGGGNGLTFTNRTVKMRPIAQSTAYQYGLRRNYESNPIQWFSIGFHEFTYLPAHAVVWHNSTRYTAESFYEMLCQNA